ncbi:MAG: hypothetical protein GF400_07185 [Candidatus Eisenbacteria bacterium]|nr:hypothetical protein [Candidatus Eisenbacteria bacterium]
MAARRFTWLFVLLVAALAAQPAAARGPARAVAFDPSSVEVVEAGKFSAVSVPGLRSLSEPGAPDLPARVLHFVIPGDSRVEDVVAEYKETELRGAHLVLPAQPEVPIGETPRWAEPDPSIYESAEPYPESRVVYLGDGYLGGYRIASVAVYPIQYVPSEGRLVLATDVSVELELARGANRSVSRRRMTGRTAELYRGIVSGMVENPWDVARVPASGVELVDEVGPEGFSPRWSPSLEGSPVEYVIITNDELAPYFQDLADWKTQKGVPAVVKTVSWINSNYPGGCDTPERIRLFIRDAYTSWGTSYVLLGGDTGVVPPRYVWSDYYGGWEISTDLYYSDLDGNWNDDGDSFFGEGYAGYGDQGDSLDLYSEVFVGRAPATTTLEAETFVDKALVYEKTPSVLFSDRNLYLAEVLFPYDWEPGDVISSDGAGDAVEPSLAFVPPEIRTARLYQNYTAYPGSYELGREAAIDSLETGYNIACHVGHGNKDVMRVSSGDYVSLNDVNDLSNGQERSGFVWMLNCTSTKIEADCIAERFINNAGGGATMLWGPSRFCFPTTARDYFVKWFERFYTEDITGAGPICAASRSPFVGNSDFDNTDRWTQVSFILLGDPETSILTGRPKSLTVVHSQSVALGEANVSVTVTDPAAVDSAYVCIAKDGEVYETAYTNASGQAVLTVVPQTTGQMTITVTAQNRFPYEDTISVLTTPSAHITLRDASIDDDAVGGSDGNANGRAESGETIELSVTVGNGGGGAASGVEAELSSTDSYITVTDSTETLGEITGGEVLDFEDAFTFAIGNDCPNGHEAVMTVEFTDAARTTWSSDYTLVVSRPEFVQLHNDVDDGGDGVPDVGESFVLAVELLNEGNGDADAVTGVLRYPNAQVTVTDSTDVWGDIAAGSTGSGSGGFACTVDSVMTDLFELRLTDEDGKTWTTHFDLFAPDVPETLAASVQATTIYLTWDPVVASDLWGYNIYRAEPPGGDFSQANDGVVEGISYYEDHGLQENKLYSYRVTSVDLSGNESAPSAVLEISTNPPAQSGWPLTGGEGMLGSPLLCDIDDDGYSEIIVGSGDMYCWRYDGAEYHDGDGDPRTNGVYNADGTGGYWASPALAELDGDAGKEIVAAAWGNVGTEGDPEYEIFAWNAEDSSILPGWPVYTQGRCWSTPAMGDLDRDGLDETIILASDGRLYVYSPDGTEFADGDGDPSTTGVFRYMDANYNYGSVAVVDLDDDHELEMIVPSRSDSIYCLNPDGSDVPGWPVYVREMAMSSPVVGDVDLDGSLDVVAASNADSIWIFDASGVPLPGWPQYVNMKVSSDGPPSPTIADLSGGDELEIIMPGSDGSVSVWDYTGDMLPGWPQMLETPNLDNHASASVGDVDGDSGMEILVGSNSGQLYAFDVDGDLIAGWPIETGIEELYSTPTLFDLDLDGDVEVIHSSMNRSVYVWDCEGSYDDGDGVEWGAWRGNMARNGLYGYAAPVSVPEDGAVAERRLVLEQNVPNPFNPVTVVAFSVPGGTGRATLSVYNIAGERVRTLVDGPVDGGRHNVTWDGRDDAGERVASGVYFVRLETPDLGATERKAVLLK